VQEALPRLRITAGDLIESLRGKDIFSPAEVLWGVVEPNGHISTAVVPAQDGQSPMLPLLVDQALYSENLTALGLDESWLDQQLQQRGLTRRQVLLLLYNGKKLLLVEKKTTRNGWSGKDTTK